MKYILLLVFFFNIPTNAEIHKEAYPTVNGLEFRWWPVLPDVEGWKQDKELSLQFGINAQTLNGESFANAETVIYSRAISKSSVSELKTLTDFIENDKSQFLTKSPSIDIHKKQSIINADNLKLESYSFIPKSSGNWEQVSYMEEGEFYIIFAISSRSELGFNRYLNVYKEFIESYEK